MTKTRRIIPIFIMAMIITCLFMAMIPAQAASNTLNVDLLRYEPYPAEIGSYVTVAIKVENFAAGNADDVSIRMDPEYPLSLDSENNAIENIGMLPPDRTAIHEYRLYVDENSKVGTASFDVYSQSNEGPGWQKDSFEIKIGSATFDSKGNVALSSAMSKPEVFMPGDEGSMTFTLSNTAQSSTIVIDEKTYDTFARVQSATLTGTDGITVTSNSYEGIGVLGPGDSIQVTYNIRVSDTIQDDTYYLDLETIGNSNAFNNNWMVPLVVDSSSIRVIPSKPLVITNGEGTLEFDVANIHPNTLSSVAVQLEAEGIEFHPIKYFVGSMDPDELFTIEITAKADDPDYTGTVELDVHTGFRNALNEHEEFVDTKQLVLEHSEEDNSNNTIAAVLVVAVIAIAGYYIYRKKYLQK